MIVNEEICKKALAHGISLTPGTSLAGHIALEKGNRIYSGSLTNVTLGAYSYIVSGTATTVSIGRYCSIAHGVEFGFYNHPTDWLTSHPFPFHPYMPDALQWPVPMRLDPSPDPILIGNDVWIGAHAKIMGGVVVGDGAIVATGSVVTKDVEPYSIIGGTPAKLIRKRFDRPLIETLITLKWWNYDWPKMLREGNEGGIEWNAPWQAISFIERQHAAGLLDDYQLKRRLQLIHEEHGCRLSIGS